MTMFARDLHAENKNMLWLEVTNFCNLQCGHCYNASGPQEPLESAVTPERFEEILSEARAIQFQRVQFIGGEPLFYPHLRRLVDHASTVGFEDIEIFSNLTAVPDWLLRPEYRHLKIATSFYSDDARTHDAIAQTPGAFKRTVASIEKLIAAGFKIRAGYIEMEANAGHYERAHALLNELGVTEITRDDVRAFGRAEGQEQPDMAQLCGQCSRGNMSIDANGNVSGCIMSKPWAFGNARETGLEALFNSPGRLQFKRDLEHAIEQREPTMCSPYDSGQCGPNCAPACSPSQGCNPSSDRTPCNPNGRCGPF